MLSDSYQVVKLEYFAFVYTGECHVSPAVLASMWKEEETKCKNLEDRMKGMLKGKGVYTSNYFFRMELVALCV